MKPVQGAVELVLPNVAAFGTPVFRIFHEITDRQPDVRFNGRKNADDPAAPADLPV